MLNYSEVYIYSDQPTTCPKCGNRTDFFEQPNNQQIHVCMTVDCKYEFLCEESN